MYDRSPERLPRTPGEPPVARTRRLAALLTPLAHGVALAFVAVAATTVPGVAQESPGPGRLLGFDAARSAEQLQREAGLDAAIATLDEAGEIDSWVRSMTVRPHHVGAPQTEENARWMLERFREWGFEAEIETFHVLVPFPEVRRLELLAPTPFVAGLEEAAVAGDSTSRLAVDTGLPPFNAYSADGTVEGELVYVNQGVPRDYEELERRGISVEGKIVIARYGGSWRGIKPKVAAEHGAIGCIIFNDPLDDGYFQGGQYPDGAFKHPSAVQRGSVLDMPLRPGDPLTPGVGATEEAERLDRSEAETILTIPVLPISAQDAQPLLAAMAGPVAPESWRGALPVTYRIGPGPARVRLELRFDWGLRPAHNVIARLRGSELPDQWVVRGNHHDAWVIGARDPISGLVALLAGARGVSELARSGWRPRRSIVYAAWDAEEPGLLGSTEWAEHHAEELRRKVVAYVNSDSNSRGFLYAGGSHALETLVAGAAEGVEDPQTGVSVAERRRAARAAAGEPEETLRLSALGSGSDYTPFLQHLGIASLNLGFGGEGNGGEYHTAFDSYDFYRRFVDPESRYAATLARLAGRVVLRLADADVLPFDFTRTAATVAGYLDEVEKLIAGERDRVEKRNRLIEKGHLVLAADPTETFVPPEVEPRVPYLDFSPLHNAVATLEAAAAEVDLAVLTRLDAERRADLDEAIYRSERLFTDDEGLPRRPWFRHQIYAPGFYTGYGVKTLPAVREAIEEHAWEEAQAGIRITAERIREFAESVEEVAAAAGAGPGRQPD